MEQVELPEESKTVTRRMGRKHRKRPRKPDQLKTLEDLDGRTNAAKRAHLLVAGLEQDLGGADHITVGQRELIKRAALLGAYLEDCEVRWLRKEPIEIQVYSRAVNSQRRVLTTLGLERRQRDITPTLTEYTEHLDDVEDAGDAE